MNVPDHQTSQSLKLPIPKLHNTTTSLPPDAKFPDVLVPNNWQSATQFPSTQVTTCQPMLTSTSSMTRLTQNKRGRKPLSKMPETKKHKQNLTNQRAFRKRREDYIRDLENKAATYELMYNDVQNDVKILQERLATLERRLAKTQENKCDDCNRESDTSGDVVTSNVTYDDNQLSAITPTNMSFSYKQRYQQQIKQDLPINSTNSANSVESVEDIINNPVFCETKEGDICFCESIDELSIDDVEKEQAKLSTCYIEQKDGKRMWIIPKRSMVQYSSPSCNDSSQTSRNCCPTIPTEQSQWPSQQRLEHYFSSSLSPIEPSTPNFTQHHPLNLSVILGNNHNDENSDDST